MPPAYSPSQRASIAQFISFTQAKESVAAKGGTKASILAGLMTNFQQHLKSHNWNVELAIDSFYANSHSNNNSASASAPIHHRLSKLFDTYRDSPQTEPDKILINGAQAYLSDLSIAVDEVVHFALCDLLKVESIGEFERTAFVAGWLDASSSSPAPLDTIARQSAYIGQLRKRLSAEPAYFKAVYRAAFKFAKPEHQRSVPLESALEFWKMFFSTAAGGIEWNGSGRGRLDWLDLWLEFYETQGKRPVNKDLWNMVGELALKIRAEGEVDADAANQSNILDDWRADGAWPYAIDDFIAWVKERQKSPAAAAEDDRMDTS